MKHILMNACTVPYRECLLPPSLDGADINPVPAPRTSDVTMIRDSWAARLCEDEGVPGSKWAGEM